MGLAMRAEATKSGESARLSRNQLQVSMQDGDRNGRTRGR